MNGVRNVRSPDSGFVTLSRALWYCNTLKPATVLQRTVEQPVRRPVWMAENPVLELALLEAIDGTTRRDRTRAGAGRAGWLRSRFGHGRSILGFGTLRVHRVGRLDCLARIHR